ncbi:MAG: DUF4097 family beta strand repeat protein [Acidobacteria bacterium]|nr:DUF4097 family beta strand repeat protein [Acidobacteriota bacterium]
MPEVCRVASAGLAVLTAVALTACDVVVGGIQNLDKLGGRATDTWTRTYPVEAGGRLAVVNTNGRIDVEAYDGSTIEVKAEKVARALSDDAAKDLLQMLEISEQASAREVRLQTRHRRRITGGSVEVRYHVRAPKTVKLDVETTNGAIQLVGMRAEVQAETVNGGVTARDLGGALKASTVNGPLQIALADVPADISLETTNGGIRLTLPENAKADISANVTNGGISLSGLDQADVREKTRRRLEARLNGGGPRITLETTNGGIRISGR